MELNSKEGLESYIEFVKEQTTKQVAADGHVLARVELLVTKDPEGNNLPSSGIAVIMLSSEDFTPEGKRFFADKLKAACEIFGAVAVIRVMEAWKVSAPDMKYEPQGSLEFHPNRTECVIIQVEHKLLNATYTAPIEEKNNERYCGEFTRVDKAIAKSNMMASVMAHNQN